MTLFLVLGIIYFWINIWEYSKAKLEEHRLARERRQYPITQALPASPPGPALKGDLVSGVIGAIVVLALIVIVVRVLALH